MPASTGAKAKKAATSSEEAQATVPTRSTRRMRRTLRKASEVDPVVLSALERIRASKGGATSIKVGVGQIMENFDARRRRLPSRAGVYRSIRRMNGVHFVIAREGERGYNTYNFEGISKGSVKSSPAPARKARVTAAAAMNGQLASLIDEERTLTTEVNQMMAELTARVDALRSQKTALQSSLRETSKIPA